MVRHVNPSKGDAMNGTTRILIADDEPAVLEVLSTILRRAGFEVWEASTGQQCLQLTREKRPDLVLLDVMLPDLNGFDVCRQIKTDPARLDIFVVLISGKATSVADKVQGAETGADDFMIKPVNPDEFLARIRTIVRLRETTIALRAGEQHYRQLVEILPDAVGVINPAGQLKMANQRAVEMLGYADPEELLKKSAFDLTPAEEHERMKADIAATLEKGIMRNAEYLMLRKDGARVPVELSAVASTGAEAPSRRIIIVARDITARRQAEARVRELLHLLDQAQDVIIIRDLDGCIQYFNQGAERLLGWTPDEVRGQRITGLFFTDASAFAAAQKKLLQTGEWNGEIQAITKARKPILLHCRWTLVRRHPDQPQQVVCICADITGRREAEEAIRQIQERYRTLAESSPDAISILSRDSAIQYVNPVAAQWLGKDHAELLGRLLAELFPPEIARQLHEALHQVFETGDPVRIERGQSFCGIQKWIEVRLVPLRNPRGKILSVMSIFRDLTEQKRVADALKEREALSQKVIGSAMEGFWMLDAEGNLVDVNETYCRMSGYSRQELLTKHISDLEANEVTREQVGQHIRRIAQAGSDRFETRHRRKDGQIIDVEVVATILKLREHHVFAFMRDITQRKQAEAHLRLQSAALESAANAIVITDRAGSALWLNPAFTRLTGYTAREVVGQNLRLLKSGLHDQAFYAKLWETILGGQIWQAEMVNRRKDGSLYTEQNIITPVRDERGEITHFVAIKQDITRRKEADQLLRASQERFQQLAENIKEVFWITNPEKSEIIYISPGYEAVWGRTCASLYATPASWLESIHPDDRQRVTEAALTQQVSGRYDEVYRIRRAGGSLRWIHDRAFPIRDDSGNVYRVVGIAEDITQQKNTEDALRHAEARYRSIFENATEGVFRTTPEGRILIANPALARMFGYSSPQEMISSVTDVGRQVYVSPEKRQEMKRLLMERGTIQGFEEENYRKDGSIIWVSLNAHLVSDESGAVQYFEGTIQDITERKRAEGQLLLLAHAVESTGEIICITDVEDKFTFVNRAFLEAYGYAREEILGKTPQLLISPNNDNPPALLSEILGQTRSAGWRGEVLDRRKDGTDFPIFLSTSKIVNPGGAVIGLMGVGQDITERKRAEEQIRLLAYAVQSARDIIWITDSENRFTFVNRSFVEAYDYSPEEVLGRTRDLLVSAKNPAATYEDISRRTRDGSWRGELLNRRKDGTEFPISLSTSEIKNSAGKTIGLIGVARDITERKQAEEVLRRFSLRIIEVQEAERLRVARELHDGVNQIIASAKMRLHKVEDSMMLNPAAREILARCSRLLVHALEENRRIAHNLRPSDLDVFGLAAASRNFCRELQSRTKLAVKCYIARFDQRLSPAVELNLFRIMQEAFNNIEKHARAAKVQLRIVGHGDSIVMKIRDDGRGFDPKRARMSKGKWGGIGLTNMRERAESLGGTCTVASAPKHGTTITVRVPQGMPG
jgi:PAS domain S-box-containing protein